MLDTGFVEQRTVGNRSISAGLVAMLGDMSSVTKGDRSDKFSKGRSDFSF